MTIEASWTCICLRIQGYNHNCSSHNPLVKSVRNNLVPYFDGNADKILAWSWSSWPQKCTVYTKQLNSSWLRSAPGLTGLSVTSVSRHSSTKTWYSEIWTPQHVWKWTEILVLGTQTGEELLTGDLRRISKALTTASRLRSGTNQKQKKVQPDPWWSRIWHLTANWNLEQSPRSCCHAHLSRLVVG